MRSSGVLLHISSLPGRHGIGDLGQEAHQFAGFLASARQKWWQMFPLGPPGMGSSPYQALSAFAGNPLFINLDALYQQGLLTSRDLKAPRELQKGKVRFDAVLKFKRPLFRKAFARFETETGEIKKSFRDFCNQEKFWLDDYALFCALKEKNRGAPWTEWDPSLRNRKPAALKAARARLAIKIRYHQFLQFQFHLQWSKLKKICEGLGVGLIGDIPIFVAHDSSDVWANQKVFWLDKNGQPTFVAGVPPDYFSRTGQRWGNPLYRWDALKKSGYSWWVKRFEKLFELFDSTRLDHFIGFHNYWRIPAGHRTAMRGKWVLGPGADFFQTLFKKLGRLNLIAEDLGVVTDDVKALRDRFKFPGMAVLQFAFGESDGKNPFLPHNLTRRVVVYTGTHDNDTTVGWFRSLNPQIKKRVKEYLQTTGREIHWDLIRLAQSTCANTAIFPAQDILGLDSRYRMNRPGLARGNWGWRLEKGALKNQHAKRLGRLTQIYGRS